MKDLSDSEFIDLIFTEGDLLGKDFLEEANKRRENILPELRRIASSKEFYEKEHEAFWGVIHAVYLLGILRDEGGIEALIKAVFLSNDYEIDWIDDSIGECFSLIGPKALPKLMDTIRTLQHGADLIENFYSLSHGVWNIYEKFPETGQEIEDFFISMVRKSELDSEIRTIAVSNLIEIGREDLRPEFEVMFDRGELDLDVLTPDDMEVFYRSGKMSPAHFYDIKSFYSEKSIKERQRRWVEEEEMIKGEELLQELQKSENQPGRNEPCPCGSEMKFKKCCLPKLMKLKEDDKDMEEVRMLIGAITVERESEVGIRKLLAKYEQTDIFTEIRLGVMNNAEKFLKDPDNSYLYSYSVPILDRVDFLKKSERKDFKRLLRNYFDAVLYQQDVFSKREKQ